MKTYSKGDKVRWKWGRGFGRGIVQSSHTKKVSRTINGKEITRNGSEENPAYYIRVEESNNVLKLHSELQKDS